MDDINKKSFPLFTKFNFYVLFFLLCGLFLRFYHFFSNRSLWLDEGYLSSSLLRMGYSELAHAHLDYQQKAPLGLLWLVKLSVDIFGKNEYALRLVPLISGILSMFIFIPVTKYFLQGFGRCLAVGLLCLAPALVYHSVEIKQYSTELLCTILAFYFFIKFQDRDDLKSLLQWGIGGMVLLWFSYFLIFVLAGFALAITIANLLKGRWKLTLFKLIPFSLWIVSFLFNYIFFISKGEGAQWVVYWFNFYGNFMPFPPKSMSDLNWFAVNIYRMLDYPLGLLWSFMNVSSNAIINQLFKMPLLPIFLIVFGIWSYFKKEKKLFFLLTLPILIVFVASGLKLYPLTERFWVFISPFFFILIAYGVENLNKKSVQILVVILVLVGPIYQSSSSILHPETFYMHKKSFQKEMFSFINKNFEANDAVYIYWNELPGYKVYKKLYHYKFEVIEGSDFRNTSTNFSSYNKNLALDFKKIKQKRVWLVYNNKYLANVGDLINDPVWYYSSGFNPTRNIENEFLKMGEPIRKLVTSDVTICLFNLKKQP